MRQQIENLEFPSSLHKKIMHKVFIYKHRFFIMAGSASLVLLTGYQFFKTFQSINEIEGFAVMKDLISTWDFQLDGLSGLFSSFSGVLPMNDLLIMAANISALILICGIVVHYYAPYLRRSNINNY